MIAVPLMDLRLQHSTLQPELGRAVGEVIDSAGFILGPQVGSIEREVSSLLGVRHGIGVASGTDALVLALRALGIGSGDEVIVPAFTFFATASAVMLVGASPILVDVTPDTYCIDVEQVAARMTERTRAVIPVHLFGHPADMDPLMEVTASRRVAIIEDNAQAIGAEYRGRATGGIGDVGCLSFYPTKNLGAGGDAGMVLTNDAEIASMVQMLRTHGWKEKYFPELLGQNSRLDALQAAILRVKLPHLRDWNERRRDLANRYQTGLRDLPLKMQSERPDVRSVYHLFVVQVSERERLAAALAAEGVETAIYYPFALHEVPAWPRGIHSDLPVAEQLARECLAIPLYPEMTNEQQDYVIDVIRRVLH